MPDEIELTEEDDAILDRVWERAGREQFAAGVEAARAGQAFDPKQSMMWRRGWNSVTRPAG